MGYFEARFARRTRNNDALKNLADKVMKEDSSVQAYYCRNDEEIESITFIKGEEISTISFTEVPFQWSGPEERSAENQENIAMPYTAKDVLGSFYSIKNVKHRHDSYFQSKEEYLKWCSYLIKYNGKDIVFYFWL